MDHLFIDRGTQSGREAVIALKSRSSPKLAGHVFGNAVKLQRGKARLAHRFQLGQYLVDDQIGLAENVDLLPRFQMDQLVTPAVSSWFLPEFAG